MRIKSSLLALSLLSTYASAAPWCKGGTIADVAAVTWSGQMTITNTAAIVAPLNHPLPDYYKIFHAAANFCEAYEGGGGPVLSNTTHHSGSVNFYFTSPYQLTNIANNYELSMGASFMCEKCFSTVPFQAIKNKKSVGFMPSAQGLSEYLTNVENE